MGALGGVGQSCSDQQQYNGGGGGEQQQYNGGQDRWGERDFDPTDPTNYLESDQLHSPSLYRGQ